MKFPKYIENIKDHYRKCWSSRNCLSCGNIIAFGVIQIEGGFLNTKNYSLDYERSGMFWKYLQSLGSNRNHCPFALSRESILKLHSWLIKQNQKNLEHFRDFYLFSNSEFKSENSPI